VKPVGGCRIDRAFDRCLPWDWPGIDPTEWLAENARHPAFGQPRVRQRANSGMSTRLAALAFINGMPPDMAEGGPGDA
jgi:hypothetical protein